MDNSDYSDTALKGAILDTMKFRKNNFKKDNSMEVPSYPMRINKYLALNKYSTRRGADELIEKHQVFINDRMAVLGDKVMEKDVVEVRFRGKQKPLVYFAYNKPKGLQTEEIKYDVALKDMFPIGRLDKDSHGLMILTNDGRVTDRLLSPKYDHEKEYVVSVKDKLRTSFKDKMEAGVKIEKETTLPCKVKVINENTFRIILTEGKKHQIRRMCVALFQEVRDLKRVRVMNINLGKLAVGAHRQIEGEELNVFLKSLGL